MDWRPAVLSAPSRRSMAAFGGCPFSRKVAPGSSRPLVLRPARRSNRVLFLRGGEGGGDSEVDQQAP